MFNRSSLRFGGRFYGGFWQNIPKVYRPFITIDGHPTIELDYSSLHPTMIYHQRGLDPVGDPYHIPDLDAEYRTSVKRAFLVLINATDRARHLESLDDIALPPGWNVPRLTKALETKHAAVSDAFRSDSGVRLQRLDAEMAGYVMREMRVRHRALVLPVHDSFIATEDQEANLSSIMSEAYTATMGNKKIGIERKASIFDSLNDPNETSDQSKFLRYVEGMLERF